MSEKQEKCKGNGCTEKKSGNQKLHHLPQLPQKFMYLNLSNIMLTINLARQQLIRELLMQLNS